MDPTTLIFLAFILMLSILLGFEIISKVPATLAHAADVRFKCDFWHYTCWCRYRRRISRE